MLCTKLKYQLPYFFLLFVFTAHSQDVASLPKLSPSHTETFSDYKSFPSICFENAFEDKSGRLWLVPCASARKQSALHLFMFDGYDFTFVRGEISKLPINSHIIGMLNQETLIGYIEREDESKIFSYNVFEQQLKVQDLNQKGTLVTGIQREDQRFLFVSREHYKVTILEWQLELDKIHEIASCEAEITDTTPEFGTILYLDEEECWIDNFDRTYFTRFNYKTGKSKKYFADDFKGRQGVTDPFLALSTTADIRLFHQTRKRILRYINEQFVLFQLNPDLDVFEEVRSFPPSWNVHRLFEDKIGNELLICNDEANNFRAILEDTAGIRFDYTPFMDNINRSKLNLVTGPDFKEKLISCNESGITIQWVKNTSAIRHYLAPKSIRAMVELPDHRFLISFQGLGWHFLDETKGSTYWADVPGCNFNERGLQTGFFTDGTGNIWAAHKDLIIEYNPFTNSCENHNTQIDIILFFTFIGKNRLAIIDKEGQLFLHDLIAGRSTPVLENNIPKKFEGTVHDLYYDQAGVLWIATSSGLWRVDLETFEMQVIGKEPPFFDPRFLCIEPDEKGRLWLGTPLAGLNIYDPVTGDVIILNNEKGLGNNTVASIVTDDDGDRWLGTYNGISIVDKEGALFANLNLEDGLIEKENNRFAAYKAKDGKLLIGTVKGLNVINPREVKARLKQTSKPQIYLTSLEYFDTKTNQSIVNTYHLDDLSRIQLPASRRFINLKFALSNYYKPKENQYAYKLEGLDKNWTFLGTQPSLSLNNLPVGKYQILIRGSDPVGNWTEEPVSIPIHAKEFFYKQPWFYSLLLLLLGGIAFLWIQRLRTEVKKATRKIREDKEVIESQAEQLKELDKAKSQFFTNISHEFRTPLTVISGMAERLEKDPHSWAERGSQLIKRNSTNLLNLINQILDLRKLESGKLEVSMIQSNIVSYLKYIFESFQSYAQSKQVKMHFLCQEKEIMMDYDPDKILRIISNLLSNAIKFTPEKGNIFLIAEKISHSSSSFLLIKVKDTGTGIPSSQLSQIFNRFYQANQHAEKTRVKDAGHLNEGTGIGLALIKELVKLLEGDIQVTSEINKGSTFTITLPIHQKAQLIPEEASLSLSPRPLNPEVSLGKRKPANTRWADDLSELPLVLVIEDNEDVIQYLEACMEDLFRVATAMDGQQGIEKAIEMVPDAIISDIMMPQKDGYEVCDTLKNDERTSHIPIILLTARADAESRLSGLRKGADDYLTKPFNEEELLIRLNNLMTLRQKLQARFQNPNNIPPIKETELKIEHEFLQKIRHEMEAHLSEEDFGIVHLCRAIDMSRTQLHRKIKALTSYSTSQYLRKIRLQKAKELLETTELNVSEVTFKVGFRYPQNFSTAYMEEFGTQPSKTSK